MISKGVSLDPMTSDHSTLSHDNTAAMETTTRVTLQPGHDLYSGHVHYIAIIWLRDIEPKSGSAKGGTCITQIHIWN